MINNNLRHKRMPPSHQDGTSKPRPMESATATYWNTPQPAPVIDKRPPGYGFRHFLKKRDILGFIELLPEWEKLSEGLNAIVLAEGSDDAFGYHYDYSGVIELCAWPREMVIESSYEFIQEHQGILQQLEVAFEKRNGYWIAHFSAPKIRAFQLLHILLHELGHHHDRMSTKKKLYSSRGEGYAEWYAHHYEQQIWSAYLKSFGIY